MRLMASNFLLKKNNLYFTAQKRYNTSLYNDSVSLSSINRVNNKFSQTTQKSPTILYKNRNIGLKPISFGSNAVTYEFMVQSTIPSINSFVIRQR